MSSKEWNNKENKAAMIMLPLREVRRALYSDDCVSPFVREYNVDIYPFLKGFFAARNAAKNTEDGDSFVNHYREYIEALPSKEGQRTAIIAVLTFWALNSWIKSSLRKTLDKKSAVDGETGSKVTVFDSGSDYAIMEELSLDRGFMNAEDIARDIVLEAAMWQRDVYAGITESPTDLPWNRLISRYRATSAELHVRHGVPSLDECESFDEDSGVVSLNLGALTKEANAIAHSYGRESDLDKGYLSPQQALIELNYDLVATLYPRKRDSLDQGSYTFLYDCGGYYALNYAALRARINYLKRTKSGIEALSKLESQLGYSRLHKGDLLTSGKARLTAKRIQKSHTGGAISKLIEHDSYSAPISSPAGLERARKGKIGTANRSVTHVTTVETFANGETQKTTTRGRGRPKKKGRGRPKKVVV